MYDNCSILAFIPARAGSKGLPNKNIENFAGKPLIEWTISAANNVNFFDDVIVSTNSEKIANISSLAGASVPFLRPDEIAQDNSNIWDAVKHGWLNHLDPNGKHFDYVVMLQPTSPLRNSEHILSAIEHYFNNRNSDQDTLISVMESDKKNNYMMQIQKETGYINLCLDVNKNYLNRQDLKPIFLPNGAIFIIKGTEIDGGVYRKNTIPFIMDISNSIDIDYKDDFMKAESLFIDSYIR